MWITVQKYEFYLFSFVPVLIVVRQKAQISELKLERRRFRGAHKASITSIVNSRAHLQVDHWLWKTRGSVESREQPVSEVLSPLKKDRIVIREVVCREKTPKDSNRCLAVCEFPESVNGKRNQTSKVLKFPSRSKDCLFATQFRALSYSSCSPIICIVSIESTMKYPIPPASVRFDPFFSIGWYSSLPMASRSVDSL
jgi:hypothetical protein